MLSLFMLLWVGLTLSAPAWFGWCWGIAAFTNILTFGWNMYKAGSK